MQSIFDIVTAGVQNLNPFAKKRDREDPTGLSPVISQPTVVRKTTHNSHPGVVPATSELGPTLNTPSISIIDRPSVRDEEKFRVIRPKQHETDARNTLVEQALEDFNTSTAPYKSIRKWAKQFNVSHSTLQRAHNRTLSGQSSVANPPGPVPYLQEPEREAVLREIIQFSNGKQGASRALVEEKVAKIRKEGAANTYTQFKAPSKTWFHRLVAAGAAAQRNKRVEAAEAAKEVAVEALRTGQYKAAQKEIRERTRNERRVLENIGGTGPPPAGSHCSNPVCMKEWVPPAAGQDCLWRGCPTAGCSLWFCSNKSCATLMKKHVTEICLAPRR